MNFAEKLKEIRTEKQLTQAELAAYIGITVTTVNRWENGGHMPGYRNICNIANALNISALDFLDKDNTDKKEQTEIKKAYRMQKNILDTADRDAATLSELSEINNVEKAKKNIIDFLSQENLIDMKAASQLETVLHTLCDSDSTEEYNELFDNTTESEERKHLLTQILLCASRLNILGMKLLQDYIICCLASHEEFIFTPNNDN